jgi:uncharacterized membrane protein YfcA
MTVTIPLRWQGVLVVGSLAVPCCLWATGVMGSLIDSRSVIIFIVVFLGSVVVGAAGFASAAVAGALMLFWLVPMSGMPILNSASFTTQIISVGQLWRGLQWRGCSLLIAGGLIGIPLGVLLLQRADPDLFRLVFGLFLAGWSLYLLGRPHLQLQSKGPLADGIVGLTGGISGGAIAFPGAYRQFGVHSPVKPRRSSAVRSNYSFW